MIVNGTALLAAAPFKLMETTKIKTEEQPSHGLSEAGYDIRIKQDVTLHGLNKFSLASAIEEFQMPDNLVGVVHDKSTWARRGLSVFNTVIEPEWSGFLTLELVYHRLMPLHIKAGSGIAQVLFSTLATSGHYDGKYQNQANRPVDAIYEKG